MRGGLGGTVSDLNLPLWLWFWIRCRTRKGLLSQFLFAHGWHLVKTAITGRFPLFEVMEISQGQESLRFLPFGADSSQEQITIFWHSRIQAHTLALILPKPKSQSVTETQCHCGQSLSVMRFNKMH